MTQISKVHNTFGSTTVLDCQRFVSKICFLIFRGSIAKDLLRVLFEVRFDVESLSCVSRFLRGSIAKDLLRVLFEVRFDKSTLWPRRAGCSRKGARPVQHMKVPEQALGNTSPSKNSCDRTRPQLGTYQLSH